MDIFDNLNLDRTAKVINESVSRLHFSSILTDALSEAAASLPEDDAKGREEVYITQLLEAQAMNIQLTMLNDLGFAEVATTISRLIKPQFDKAQGQIKAFANRQEVSPALVEAMKVASAKWTSFSKKDDQPGGPSEAQTAE